MQWKHINDCESNLKVTRHKRKAKENSTCYSKLGFDNHLHNLIIHTPLNEYVRKTWLSYQDSNHESEDICSES